MILVTNTFKKLLSKIKSVSIDEIKNEIEKYNNWIDNFKTIGFLRNRKVIKGYLLSKKVRLIVLFKENSWNYLPFYIVKKETKDWYNISKLSLKDLDNKLDNIFEDLEKWSYEIF